MSKFAERLKELRIENNLTLKQLSKELGSQISSSAIQFWETNQRVPNFDMVILIAQYFGVSTDYLAGLED